MGATRLMGDSWSDGEAKHLTELWRNGHTASEISKIMGGERTRSSILGKAMRLGLPTRETTATTTRRVRARTEAETKPYRPVYTEPVPIIVGEPRPWITRKFGECAYPIDVGDEVFSCCAKVKSEKNYCKTHYKVMYSS